MSFGDIKERSTAIEIMDDLEMKGDVLLDSLNKIAGVNQWLGGNEVSLNGLERLLRNHSKEETYTLADLGCGNGDLLREIALFGRKKGYQFALIGIDANQATVDHAIHLSADFPEIEYIKEDILSLEFQERKFDIVSCTLFLHHFSKQEIEAFLKSQIRKTSVGIIINDLHRNWIAYGLFWFVCLFIKNEMVKIDGLISIQKGFTQKELAALSTKLKCKSELRWKWAFRYQWIIKTL